jgi:hypothetical protein
MYSTCLFCHGELGSNEVVEQFPIGRRLAFDSSKGRLWVVCRKCERWNLTPIEERWEAIEACERLFETARLRVATDNIGLARLKEGLELVRVGTAQRPEFAAWRYGDQFNKRRTRNILVTAAGIIVVGSVVGTGISTGVIAGGGWGMYQGAKGLYDLINQRRTRLRVALPDTGEIVALRKRHLEHTELMRDDKEWTLRLSYVPPEMGLIKNKYRTLDLKGSEALRVAGQVLPKVNVAGGNKREVQDAVQLVGQYPSTEKLFLSQAKQPPRRYLAEGKSPANAAIHKLPLYVRLALEMASHEEQERKALEGELAILQEAWRQAEEVAKIADEMFLPAGTNEKLDEIKKKDRGSRIED